MVAAGRLRWRVRLLERATSLDAWGEPADSWLPVASVWAEVIDLRGREFLEARQVEGAEISTRVRMRWRPGLREGMRLEAGGRQLEVTAVLDPDGRRRVAELICSEVRR